MTGKTKKPKAKEQRLEEIERESIKLDEAITNTRAELQDLKKAFEDLNQGLEKKVDDLWSELPQSTSKGILDKLFKVSTPKRGQLQENIGKLEVSLNLLGKKKADLLLEKRRIEKEMKEDELNEQTNQVCETLKHCIQEYINFEKSFLQFKQEAIQVRERDNMAYNRIDKAKHSDFYAQVMGLSLTTPGRLPGVTPMNFITGIQNLGRPEESPLKTDAMYQREEREKPIIHNLSDEPPQLNDRELEDKIGELFENPVVTQY